MRTVSLENPPAYGALSYVWGDDKTERLISVDGKALSVWPNLEAALLEFEREPPILDPISHMERVRNQNAIFQTMSSDVPVPPPFVNDNWHKMKDTIFSCGDIFSRIKQEAGTNMGMEAYIPSEAGEDWALLNEQCSQLEILAEEFTYPKNPSWLVKQPRLLWIDAICINQRDTAERNSQVRIMGQIYLKAFLLVIWLGLEQDGSDLAFETISEFMKDVPTPPNGRTDIKDMTFDEWMSRRGLPIDHQNAVRHAIVKLFDRPWFTRGWIRQEYIFGSLEFLHSYARILVACGRKRARNLIATVTPLLQQWFNNTQSHQDGFESFYGNFSSYTISGFSNASSLNIARTYFGLTHSQASKAEIKISRGTALFKLVAESVFFRTTDPRDKIYSVFGLFQTYFGMGILDPLPVGLIIDYNASVEIVYLTFMKWVVESTRRLDIFVFWSKPYTKHIQQSWCPDWSINPQNRYHYGILGVRIEIDDYNYQEHFPFNATPGSLCQASFSKDLSSMSVLGLIWDVALRSPTPFAPQYKLDKIIEDYSKWPDPTADTRKGCQHFITSVQKEILSEPSSIFYANLLEALARETDIDQGAIPKFKKWCWSAISSDESPQNSSTTQPEDFTCDAAQDDSKAPLFNIEEFLSPSPGTILVLTKHFNVVRPSYDLVQPGDLICVFPGCPTPMMVRAVEEHFELLGPVYVPGIMRGEAMTALQEKKVKLQEFELH